MDVRLKYSLYGVAFGVCFPVFAVLLEMYLYDIAFSLDGIAQCHAQNKLIFMIDTAPIWLGLFALIGGVSKYRSEKLLNEFVKLTHRLKSGNEDLNSNSKNIFRQIKHTSYQVSSLTDKVRRSNDKMADHIKSNQENTLTLKENSGEVVGLVSEIDAINQSVQKSEQIVLGTFNSVSELLIKLASNTSKIREVGGEIKILSINSGIEAGRAGEAGVGFQVISDNVKFLSENIEQVSKEVQALVEKLQNQVKLLGSELNQQNQGITQVLQMVTKTRGVLENNRENLDKLFSELDESMEVSSEQIAYFYEIDKELNHIQKENKEVLKSLNNLMNSNSEIIEQIDRI